MKGVIKLIKMDMAICRKSMLIMTFSMLISGICCLFFLTPLLLGLFVVGSTAVISSVFAVENKSNMEFFYGCFPIRKREYVIGRSLSCLLVMAIPSVISIIFTQISIHVPLCQIEEVRMIMEMAEQYQMIIISSMIALGFIGGANLLLASFAGKIESRELFEVILLLLEGLLFGIIVFLIQKIVYHGDSRQFLTAFSKLFSGHELISCTVIILAGLALFAAGALLSVKIAQRKRI